MSKRENVKRCTIMTYTLISSTIFIPLYLISASERKFHLIPSRSVCIGSPLAADAPQEGTQSASEIGHFGRLKTIDLFSQIETHFLHINDIGEGVTSQVRGTYNLVYILFLHSVQVCKRI